MVTINIYLILLSLVLTTLIIKLMFYEFMCVCMFVCIEAHMWEGMCTST